MVNLCRAQLTTLSNPAPPFSTFIITWTHTMRNGIAAITGRAAGLIVQARDACPACACLPACPCPIGASVTLSGVSQETGDGCSTARLGRRLCPGSICHGAASRACCARYARCAYGMRVIL